MKITFALLFGATVVMAAHFWARPTAWMLTRIPPATHPDCHPRFRVWDHGVEVTTDGFPPVHV